MQRPIRRAQVRSKSNTQDQGKAWGSSPPSAAEQQTLRNWDLFKVEWYGKLRNWSFQHLKQLTLTRTILFSFLLNSTVQLKMVATQSGKHICIPSHLRSFPCVIINIIYNVPVLVLKMSSKQRLVLNAKSDLWHDKPGKNNKWSSYLNSHMRNSLDIKNIHIFYHYINTLQHFTEHFSHHSQHVMRCNMCECVCKCACMCMCISLHACSHVYAWSRDKCSNQHPYKFPEPVAQWVYSLSDGSSCAISRRIV